MFYLESGYTLVYLDTIRTYKLAWYGQNRSYLNYLRTFLQINPLATIFGFLGLGIYLRRYRKSWAAWWYFIVAFAPLMIFIIIHGGQVEPQGNYYRYLTFYVIILYPAFAYLIDKSISFVSQSQQTNTGAKLHLNN